VPLASARLQRKIDFLLPEIGTPGRLLLEHPCARELYPQFLAINFQLARAAVSLMGAALERARALAPEDRVAAALAEYLERHIREEMHGEEPGRDALDDLEALGVDSGEIRARTLPPAIAAIIESQLFWIRHRHPVAILGFLEIEAYHPDRESVEQLIAKTSLPRAGFSQLLLHAELDIEHAKDLHQVLDLLPLDLQHEQLIGVSALKTMALVAEAALDIVTCGAEPAVRPVRSVA
jgi:hypothetical protein